MWPLLEAFQNMEGADGALFEGITEENFAEAMRRLAGGIDPSAMQQVGDDVAAGVGQGMARHDFSGDSESTAANSESSLRSAYASNSPAQRMVPLGNDVSAGIGQGMTQYDFSTDSAAAANNLIGAFSTALYTKASFAVNSARSVGKAISAGMARGILDGESTVIQAAVKVAASALQAAKDKLGVASPSRVFRDEVGIMISRGIGEGILRGEREQAEIIRNAARYLVSEARGGITGVSQQYDNRRTYNQQSSVNLSGNNFYIRDEMDAQALAMEIASLTRRQQRSLGYAASVRAR